MTRLLLPMKVAALLLVMAAVLAMPSRSQAQAPIPIFKELDSYVETKDFQAPGLQLKDFLAKLFEVMAKKGKKLPILIDVDAFKEANPDVDENVFYEAKVNLPPLPEITVAEALRLAIAKIPTRNATYVVLPDRILITTFERTTAQAKLNEKVHGTFDKVPLSAALAELAQKVGVTIVVDSRCGDKAETKISATFANDIPLAGALRLLTELADLKPVVLDGAILVTTAAHAETLRKEHRKKETEYEELRLLKEKSNLPVVKGKAGVSSGGFGAPGGYEFSFYEFRGIVDPLWPYSPNFGYRREPQ